MPSTLDPTRSSTYERGLLALVATLVTLVAALHALDALPVGGFYDDAFYVILGKALATGEGYRNLNLPGSPAATHYPPGYPAFLALLWSLWPRFPDNVLLFKAANVLCLGATAGVAVHLGRARYGLGVPLALVAVLAGTVTTPALYSSSMVVSEPLFLILLVSILVVAERVVADAGTRGARVRWQHALALGAAAGCASLVRTHGVALVAAIVVAFATRRRFREAAIAGIAGVLVLVPWLAWVAANDATWPPLMRGDYGSYGAWFIDGLRDGGWAHLSGTIGRNLRGVTVAVAQRLRPPALPGLQMATVVCVLGFAAAGGVRLWRLARVSALFLVGYLAIVLVWPFPPTRFLLGIWVLVMLLLACGFAELVEVASRPRATSPVRPRSRGTAVAACGLAIVGAVVMVTGGVAYNIAGYRGHWWSLSQTTGARTLVPKLLWADSALRADRDAVLATEHDEGALYLYTGARAIPSTSFTARDYFDPGSAARDSVVFSTLVRQYGARYALLSSARMRAAAERNGAVGRSLLGRADGAGPWVYRLAPTPDLKQRARPRCVHPCALRPASSRPEDEPAMR